MYLGQQGVNNLKCVERFPKEYNSAFSDNNLQEIINSEEMLRKFMFKTFIILEILPVFCKLLHKISYILARPSNMKWYIQFLSLSL